MANSTEQLTFHYRGRKYVKELPAPDTARIEALTNQYTQEMTGEGLDKDAMASRDRARSLAESAERAERVAKVKSEVETANADKYAAGEAPNETMPEGGVAYGDPGISQRHSMPDPRLSNVTDTDPSKQETVVTSDQLLDQVPKLADKLNALVFPPTHDGFVTKAIVPTGQGSMFDQAVDMAYQMSGHGGQKAQMAQIFANIDRFGKSMAPKPIEQAGYTFITRPHLNLSDSNLATDRRFYGMMTDVYNDVAFGIRCMLDPRFCKEHAAEAAACKLIDVHNPFAVLLCNALTSINGFQDPVLSSETTDTGYFQETQSYAIGGDRMARGYDFTLNFRDYAFAPVAAAFDYWYQYMMNLADGTMIQYASDIDANRLGYTVSIYRFIVDRTSRVITRWAKCTGCFPLNSPTGVPFNKNEGEQFITSNSNFGINFKVNHVGYTSDPIIIQEFNTLVRRYLIGSSNDRSAMQQYTAYDYEAQNNFTGIPYVRVGDFGFELVFLRQDGTDGPVVDQSSPAKLANITMV